MRTFKKIRISFFLLAIGLFSCSGGKNSKSLAEQASAPEDYAETDVHAIQ